MKYKRLSVFLRKGRYAVIKFGSTRALRTFKYRDEAFHYAMTKSDIVFVNGTNGIVLFVGRN